LPEQKGNPTETLKLEMSKLRVEMETLKKSMDDTCKILKDPDSGLIVRLTKIETTLSNLKWFIPIGTGIALFIVELALNFLMP